MSKREAKMRIKNFIKKNQGKTVLFCELDESDKMDYVLTKTYAYFSGNMKAGFKSENALERAIKNAEAHKSNCFAFYNSNLTEHFVLA